MPLLNYTTSIDAHKTMGEIQRMLAKAGAKGILTQYDGDDPVALMFQLDSAGRERYCLPCRTDAVYATLQRQYQDHKIAKSHATCDQAGRVGWRILKDWVEAQLAIVESGMVAMDEVFLPYRLVTADRTVYQAMQGSLLTVKEEPA